MATTTLNLYKYTGVLNQINKTLPTPTIKTGTQVEPPQSVIECDFIIKSATLPEYNYAYVDVFKRYYFITETLWLGADAFQIHLKCDVLYTWKTQINSIQAMIEYSQLGNALERDPRLNYKDYTTSTVSDVVSYHSVYNDNTSTRDPYVMIRYYAQPARLSALDTPAAKISTIWAALMPQQTYSNMLAYYSSNIYSDTQRTAMASAIIDVSEVYYISAARVAASSLTTDNAITITTPDQPTGIVWGGNQFGANPLYICDNPAAQLSTLGYYEIPAFTVPMARYEYVNAIYETQMPFLGVKQCVPAQIGIYYPCTVKYRITFDMIGNSYVITPVVTNTVTSTTTVLYEYSEVIENHKRTGFLTNDSLDRNTWATMGFLASAAIGATTGNIGGIITSGKNMIDTQISVAAATQYKGGFSDEYEYTTTTTPDFRNIAHIIDVDTNVLSFTLLWGFPDHNVRQISTLPSGYYFKCENVLLTGTSPISHDEVVEIEKLLLSGVYT